MFQEYILSKVNKMIFLIVFVLCLSANKSYSQFYQGTQMSFGKNRVQYDDFFWSYYRFKNFDAYYYKGGMEQAIYTSKVADEDLAQIEKLFDYNLEGRMQFIIFNRLSDLKQSNIGLEGEEQYNTGGITKIVGSKVMLYFNGDHRDFRRQIREGIAQVLFNQIMFGGDVKDILQNAALLNIPEWYSKGLISYIGMDWNTTIDDRVRDGILSGKYNKFNRLQGIDAVYGGHSIWRYIIETYGESAVSNLLFMTRINRNIESGMLFVLGSSLKNLSKSWLEYYQKMYFNSDKGKELPVVKPIAKTKMKPLRIYSEMKVSPDGNYGAYVSNDIGKYKIWLYNFQTGKKTKLFKDGYKSLSQINDESFPLLSWHPGGKMLTIIRERQGNINLINYTIETKQKEQSNILGFDKVTDFGLSDDGQNLVFAGVQKGQSDIFVFNLRTRTYEQITNDFYDDFNPRFINHSTQIVFSSDRTNDSLKVDKSTPLIPLNATTDIFVYDFKNKSKMLKRLTNSPLSNEIQPYQYDSANIAYLSDENGIYNRYLAHLDSVISFIDTTEHYRYTVTSFPVTNSPRNILLQDLNSRTKRLSEIVFLEGKYKLYNETFQKSDTSARELQNTPYRKSTLPKSKLSDQQEDNSSQILKVTNGNPKTTLDSNKIDINNYTFQTEILKPKVNKKADEVKKKDTTIIAAQPKDSLSKKSISELIPLFKARNYDVGFNVNYFVSQLDNSMLNPTYQFFNPYSPVYFDPGLLGAFKVGLSDLMENYRIVGGVRLSGDLSNNEYFLSYENLKDRLDKQIAIYRSGETYQGSDFTLRVHSHEIKYSLKWPFNDVSAIRGTFSYRNNRDVILSQDLNTLQAPNTYENWGSMEAEYIYDNTINTGLNLYNGTRYKIFAQVYHQNEAIANILNQAGITNSTMYVVGMDFRNYLKIHREIIWANRFAASTSFGPQKLIYYMGGVDNWLFPKFNNSINIDQTQNYAYQAIATNLRGFTQNIRNGNSFAVINSELRIPVFQYLFNRPIKSDFVKNFQIIGFTDIGTAWTGASPYSSSNSLNKTIINNGPITVILQSQIQPIVAGYGFGLRSRLFGYFVRADYAWGIADGQIQLPIFYLSLSLDF